MGVTIHPASHSANAYAGTKFSKNVNELLTAAGSVELLMSCKEILQSSFSSKTPSNIVGTSNGFVQSCITAYSNHHRLVIRPDDVWLTIVTQLSLYINAHAEELRSHFVQHEGQKELLVQMDADRYHCSWGKIVAQFTVELEKNINDPSLKDWILQGFSTTTETDRAVGAIAMMGTMQAYFTYKAYLKCGIPSVTLEGTREDWVQLCDTVADPKRLPMFGEETAEWSRVLGAVLTRFVDSYDHPGSLRTKNFWQNIAHYSGGGSGPRYWSGWITAFCFWDDKGGFLRGRDSGLGKASQGGIGSVFKSLLPNWIDTTLRIDGQVFHRIDSNDVPPAWISVPVMINELGIEYKARMVAGVVGYDVSESGEKLENGEKGLDTLKPQTGWWIHEERSEQ
jgi:hypothetical protein